MIARCSCGRVQYETAGEPIVRLVCFCADCQAGSRQLEALPAAPAVRDDAGGTAYVVCRKDRVRCTRGAELLRSHKLRESSATSRVVATCCNAPMVMGFDDARHWTPVYRARLVGSLPDTEMRICTRSAPGAALSPDVPSYSGFPIKLLARLLTARLAMLVGR